MARPPKHRLFQGNADRRCRKGKKRGRWCGKECARRDGPDACQADASAGDGKDEAKCQGGDALEALVTVGMRSVSSALRQQDDNTSRILNVHYYLISLYFNLFLVFD